MGASPRLGPCQDPFLKIIIIKEVEMELGF